MGSHHKEKEKKTDTYTVLDRAVWTGLKKGAVVIIVSTLANTC